MTDATITTISVAFLAAMPPTIAAIAALMQGQKNAERAEALKVDVKEIHALTNSTNSNLTKSLAVATEKVSGLEKMLASLVEREKVDLARQAIPPSQRAEVVDANGDTAKGPPSPKPTAPLVNPQGDRIEQTGLDTNERVQTVETAVTDRVKKVEDDLDTKKDK